MSFYELERPTPSLAERAKAAFAPVKTWFTGLFDTLNYSRLMSVLYNMDDATLGKIGITRDQIPAYARKCIDHKT